MGRIILVLLLLISSIASAQGPKMPEPMIRVFPVVGVDGSYWVAIPGYSNISARYKWIATAVDSGLHVPQYNGVPTDRTGVWMADGCIAADTLNGNFYYRQGGVWTRVAKYSEIGTTAWGLTGNAGTTPGTNFIGTTTGGVGLMFKAGGTQSGFIDITQDNTSFGFASLISNTVIGSSNAAFGHRALTSNTDGYNNTAMGWFALAANTTNISNTAIGVSSQAVSDAFGNTSVGAFSLRDNTSGYSNVAIGTNAGLVNTTGLQNTFVGAGSAEANTTGQENTMVGYGAGLNNTTGIRNVHVGWNAKSGTNGGNNVMIGYRAGASLTAGNTTNIFIGSQSGDNASQKVDATNSIAIGEGTFTTANNQTVIGNTTITETIVRGAVTARWKARVGSTASSGTPTINTDNTDIYKITALAANITSFTTNLTGTPNDGDILEIQITDDGTPRTLAFGASFVSSSVTIPGTTTTSTTLTIVFQYYTISSYGNNKWLCASFY